VVPGKHLLYHKDISLRAGESITIFLGEKVSIDKAQVRIDLESAPPKTLILVFSKEQKANDSLLRHIRVDKEHREFDFTYHKGDPHNFTDLMIRVPEDTHFTIDIFLRP
jgi:hypothetical protein